MQGFLDCRGKNLVSGVSEVLVSCVHLENLGDERSIRIILAESSDVFNTLDDKT